MSKGSARLWCLVVMAPLAAVWLAGCGSGSGGTTAVPPTLTITSPPNGSAVAGNLAVTAKISSLAGVTAAYFKVNGTVFDLVSPVTTTTVTGRLATLSRTLANGSAVLTVETLGNAASSPAATITISNDQSLYVQDVSGAAGSPVTVRARFNDVSYVASFHVALQYDATKLQLGSVAKGADVPASSALTTDTATAGVVDTTVTGTTSLTSTSGGEALVLIFTIKTPSPSGSKTDLALSTVNCHDAWGTSSWSVPGVAGRVTTN
jgi:hypothetical protein